MTMDGVLAVTGANRGIGAEIALELARRGHDVGCLSRSGQRPALQPPDEVLAGRLRPVPCDVTDEASLRAAFRALVEGGARLTGLVNNAGIHLEGRSEQFATADFERVMAVNATAVFAASREAYPHLVAAGGGLIVNIGSFFDRMGVQRYAAYCASKAAVGAITRCLAVEWAPRGIRVIDVAPGYVLTDFNRAELAEGSPLGKYLAKRIPAGGAAAPPSAVARLVAALYAESIPFLTGETIYVDGAQGIAH
jgi:NAD(P)-dependent dehydrogenase (short-subunit alcohol dehydrogenase family)